VQSNTNLQVRYFGKGFAVVVLAKGPQGRLVRQTLALSLIPSGSFRETSRNLKPKVMKAAKVVCGIFVPNVELRFSGELPTITR
jgi:hypothetical protein